MSFGNRLKQFRKQTGLNQTEFGDKIKANQQSVSHWEKGEHLPFGDTIVHIQKAFPNLNTDWLMTGSGSMFKSGKIDKVEKPEKDEYAEVLKENTLLRSRVNELQERIQYLTDELLQLSKEYTELLKNKNK